MNSNDIQSRQNEKKLLKIQYAARVCYNDAEKMNRFAWLFFLLAAFSVFIPDTLPEQFTAKDYKASAKVNLYTARTALNILNHVGIVRQIGRQGNAYLYERV